ncbi:MAG: hypothetical protein WCZ00_00005, partial [Acholeplasmataceae bacterium]
MENYIKIYEETRKKLKAYGYMMWLMSWDRETEAPKASLAYSAKQFSVIQEELYKIESDPEYMDAIEKLYENIEQLEDPDFKVEIKNAYKDLRMIKKVPKSEYLAYGLLTQEVHIFGLKLKKKMILK